MHGSWPLPCLSKSSHRVARICPGACSGLVPLEMKWACTCGRCGSLTVKSVAGALFVALLVVVASFLLRINFRLVGRG